MTLRQRARQPHPAPARDDRPFQSLLAIDLGLRTGFAMFGHDGRLLRYRSQHYATQGTLRRAVPGILDATPSVTALAIEGGGPLLGVWEREAARRHLHVLRVSADVWRPVLLLPRDQRTGTRAKRIAGALARQVIDWSGAARPTSLRHDAAEAVLIGLWAVLALGWLREHEAPVPVLRRSA